MKRSAVAVLLIAVAVVAAVAATALVPDRGAALGRVEDRSPSELAALYGLSLHEAAAIYRSIERPTATPAPATTLPATPATTMANASTPPSTATAPAPTPFANPVTNPATGNDANDALAILPSAARQWLAANDWAVTFHSNHIGTRGFTLWSNGGASRTIDIWLGQSLGDLHHTIFHEVGHAIDFTIGDSNARNQWLEMRGLTTWSPSAVLRGHDRDYGIGDFAEAIGAVLRDPRRGHPIGVAPLTAEQRRFVLDFLPFTLTEAPAPVEDPVSPATALLLELFEPS